jgi:hypothetical protein
VFISMKNTSLAVGDEFDGAGADIVHRAGRLARGGADRLALRGVERRRRRFLDHLLVPALQRAFALEQRQQIAVAVADDLHLDVARVLDTNFSISMRSSPNAALASRLALTIAAAKSPAELHDAHAAPAAAGGRLDQHRESRSCRRPSPASPRPGPRRDSPAPAARRPFPSAPWSRFEPIAVIIAAVGPTNTSRHRRRPARIRRSPTGSRSRDARLGAGLARGLDDALDVEIAVARPRRGPISTASSAMATCMASRSASE